MILILLLFVLSPSSVLAVSSGITLTWQDNANNEASFVLERRVPPVTTWGVIVTLPANTQTYKDMPSVAGRYCYQVKAVNAGGSSAYSNEVCKDFTPAPPPPPSPDVTLALSVVGQGIVSSTPTGIACPTVCQKNVPTGTVVSLTATPSAGWQLSAWGGSCSGKTTCVVTMDAAKNVTATFTQLPVTPPPVVPPVLTLKTTAGFPAVSWVVSLVQDPNVRGLHLYRQRKNDTWQWKADVDVQKGVFHDHTQLIVSGTCYYAQFYTAVGDSTKSNVACVP